MKKILGFLALFLALTSFWLITNNAYANTTDPASTTTDVNAWKIPVVVTEEIPGANCETVDGKTTCYIEKGFKSIQTMLWNIIKYFTFLAGLWGVLFIVINGILYSMWGIDWGWKDEAKKRITKTLIGLAVLLLSWVILNIVAPWVYTF
mgnify:CR=1 FL=1